MNNIVLNSTSFLSWHSDSTAFWILLVLAILFYFVSVSMTDEAPIASIFVNLLCAGTLYLYSGTTGEAFWFLNFEKQGFVIWFICYIISAVFFGILIGMSIGHLKLVIEIFSNFWVGLIGLLIGSVWGYLLIRYIGIIFDEHPIICALAILGAISSGSASHTPTIYVDGEGHITGHGYDGGSSFRGDNGGDYKYDGSKWHRS